MYQPEILPALARIEAKLDALQRQVKTILHRLGDIEESEKIMSQELDNLATQVKSNTDAEQSAVTLLGNLGDLIKQAGTDPAKLQQLTSDLDASKQKLAAAIVANTPAAGGGGGGPTPAPQSQARRQP